MRAIEVMDIEVKQEREYLNLFYNRGIFSSFSWTFNYDYEYYNRKADSVQFIIAVSSNFFPSGLANKAGLTEAGYSNIFSNMLVLIKEYDNDSNKSK